MGCGVKRSPTAAAKTKAGRKRISSAQKQRWNAYRETKKAEVEKIN
jgi:hypothetical protein